MSTSVDQGETEPRLWQGRLLLLTLTHVVGTAGYLSVMAMAPAIRDDLTINAAQFGFFMSAFFGAQIVAALPSGVITDRLGVGWTLVLAMTLMAFGNMSFALSTEFGMALGAMFLMGLGYSLVNPATGKGVLAWFPPRRRGTAMGIKQLGVPLGGVLAAGAGALVVLVSWQSILWAVAAAGLVTAGLSIRIAERPGLGGNTGGLVRNMRHVIANRDLNAIGGSVVAFNIGQSSLFAYLVLFLRDAALASQPVAGFCMALAQGASAAGRVGFSYLSDTAFGGRRKPVIVALVVAAVAALGAAAFAGPGWSTWSLALLALCMGGTVAAYAALIVTATAEATEPALVGSAIGYNSLAWSLGGTIGPPIFGWVLDTTGSYGNAWTVTAVIVAAGVLFFALSFRERRGD